jgi:hypothetical protein
VNCVRIGYGEVANLHEKKLKELGVETLGIIETNPTKCKLAKSHGFHVFSDYEEVLKLNPFFWDICTDTSSHVEIIEKIVQLSPKANILVEKPVCSFYQLNWLQEILIGFKGKLSINENYQCSEITKAINKLIHQYDIKPSRVISEMTKNRSCDFTNGRFIDEDFFVFGYEGSHMLTNVLSLGKKYAPERISEVTFQDLQLETKTRFKSLYRQGCGKACYTAKNGVEVVLYTSMVGEIGFHFPHSPYSKNRIPVQDNSTRYRILAVEDFMKDVTVVGYYEPIRNSSRNTGMVMLIEKGKLKKLIHPIKQDHLLLSIKKAIQFFNDQAKNNYSLLEAADTIKALNMISQQNERILDIYKSLAN